MELNLSHRINRNNWKKMLLIAISVVCLIPNISFADPGDPRDFQDSGNNGLCNPRNPYYDPCGCDGIDCPDTPIDSGVVYLVAFGTLLGIISIRKMKTAVN